MDFSCFGLVGLIYFGEFTKCPAGPGLPPYAPRGVGVSAAGVVIRPGPSSPWGDVAVHVRVWDSPFVGTSDLNLIDSPTGLARDHHSVVEQALCR